MRRAGFEAIRARCRRSALGTGIVVEIGGGRRGFEAPVEEVASVESDAKEIGGDKAELGGSNADDADDGAVDASNDPALPQLLSDEHRGGDGQDTGQIIESNHVQYV